MTRAGQASLREALLAAVERSGKLVPLIVAPRRPKRNRTRYRARRAEARRQVMRGGVG